MFMAYENGFNCDSIKSLTSLLDEGKLRKHSAIDLFNLLGFLGILKTFRKHRKVFYNIAAKYLVV